jgi:hypothetical protein
MKNLEEIIVVVRSLCSYTKNFHLSPCGGCGLPSWQQPCPVCDWYPYQGGQYWTKEYNEKQRAAIQNSNYTEEGWVIKHNRIGNIALWALGRARNTIAWKKDSSFRRTIEMAESQARSMNFPTGEELMVMYRKDQLLKALEKDPGNEEVKNLLMEIGDSDCTTAVREADCIYMEQNGLTMGDE